MINIGDLERKRERSEKPQGAVPHIARAQALHSDFELLAQFLRDNGATVIVGPVDSDLSLSATSMFVTFKGTAARACRGFAEMVRKWSREAGITLAVSVSNDLPEFARPKDLQPGEERVGFVALFPR